MHRRKLKDMNLLDDFLFFSMMNYPEIGDKFSRKLLETIFNKKFGVLKIIPQKVYYGEDVDKHGIRLDVYLEESSNDTELLENATIYDIEPELKDDEANVKSLPKRIRFSHAKIDAHALKSGASYDNLKRVVIVMIMPFDPFGHDHMIYTIQNGCVELPEMEYDDGAKTIFLYTKGTKGDIPRGLQELLGYMENTKSENATNETLKEIQGMVDVVKGDAEVSGRVMRIDEKMMDARKEGFAEGELANLLSLIKKKLDHGQSVKQIAEDLLEDKKVVENLIEKHLSN